MKTKDGWKRITAILLMMLLCFGGTISPVLAAETGDLAAADGTVQTDVTYDLQPATKEEVQAEIDSYNQAYQEALASDGFTAALKVAKPHWEYEVGGTLMPTGYNCQLVDWDTDFGAEYYTFFPNPAATASITVSTIGDLQTAINSAVDGDTIELDAALDGAILPAVITVNKGLNFTTASGTITLYAAASARHFSISGTDVMVSFDNIILDGGSINGRGGITSSGTNITVDGAQIQNCNNTSTGGGGVYTSSGSLTLNDCYIMNNSANYGGGVRHDNSSTLTVNGGAMSGNTATSGGGVWGYSNSTMTLNNVDILNNIATSGGGGIWVGQGGSAKVSDCTITGNKSNGTGVNGGGGIGGRGITLTVSGGVISGNSAVTYGGGIWAHTVTTTNARSIVTITDGAVIGGDTVADANTSRFGGGVFIYYNACRLTVSNGAAIKGNTATSDGGGIYAYQSSYVTVDGSEVSGNTSGGAGGGVFSDQNATVVVTNGSEINSNTASQGGGILAAIGSTALTVTDSYVNGNTSTGQGGGIHSGRPVTISGSEINANTSRENGGGIYASSGLAVTVTDSKINGNTATYGDGGGIYVATANTLNVTGGQISGNTASNNLSGQGGEGGGIYAGAFSSVTFDAVTVNGNAATENGGAVYGEAAIKVTNDTAVFDNTAGIYGGAVYGSGNASTITVNGSAVTGNGKVQTINGIAYGPVVNGGGIYGNGSIAITDATVDDNYASGQGGGIYGNCTTDISGDTTVNGNTANYGGGIYMAEGFTLNTSGTISGNTAVKDGGGIYSFDGPINITGGSITNNTAGGGGGGIHAGGTAAIHLIDLSVMSGVVFEGNSASTIHLILDDDKAQHDMLILTNTFSESFGYGYNNYDIGYMGGPAYYPVIYDANGGSGTAPTEGLKTENSTFAAANNTFTPPNGKLFKEWNTEANGSGTSYAAGATVTMPSGSLTLYAIWETAYTLTYDANGGLGGPGTEFLLAQNDYTLATTPKPTHADVSGTAVVFIGWTETCDTTIYGKGVTPATAIVTGVDITQDMMVYALWGYDEDNDGIPDVLEYTLTVQANIGGSVNTAVNGLYNENDSITLTATVSSGYTFSGWVSSNGGSFADASNASTTFTMSSGDVTVIATFTKNTYTVIFDANDGSSVNNQTVAYGGKPAKPNNPTKEGYTFEGWYTDNGTFTDAWDFDNDVVTDNITLYAKWNTTAVSTPTTSEPKIAGSSGTGAARTGDDSGIASWVAILCVSLALMVTLIWTTRRKRNSKAVKWPSSEENRMKGKQLRKLTGVLCVVLMLASIIPWSTTFAQDEGSSENGTIVESISQTEDLPIGEDVSNEDVATEPSDSPSVTAPPSLSSDNAPLVSKEISGEPEIAHRQDELLPMSDDTVPVRPYALGDTFIANIGVDNGGVVTQVPCTFKVTSATPSDLQVQIGNGSTSAISTATAGKLILPDTVDYDVDGDGTAETYQVTSIGNWAFYKCASLTDTGLGTNTSVTTTGYGSFAECHLLVNTGLGTNTSVTSIGGWTFSICSSLTDTGLATNTSVTSIFAGGFDRCTSLTDTGLATNTSVTLIGGWAFSNCSSLTDTGLATNTSVTSIGELAFFYCTSLVDAGLATNTSVTSIGDNAFESCTSLGTIATSSTNQGDLVIPPQMSSIGHYAFTSTAYERIYLLAPSASGISVGAGAFKFLGGQGTIYIPESWDDGSGPITFSDGLYTYSTTDGTLVIMCEPVAGTVTIEDVVRVPDTRDKVDVTFKTDAGSIITIKDASGTVLWSGTSLAGVSRTVRMTTAGADIEIGSEVEATALATYPTSATSRQYNTVQGTTNTAPLDVPAVRYTIEFSGNEADNPLAMQNKTMDMDYGQAKALAVNTYTRSGYTFTGWNTAADGNGTAYTDVEQVMNLTDLEGASITLFAMWQKESTPTPSPSDPPVVPSGDSGSGAVTGNNTGNSDNNAPQTGDSNDIVLWITLVLSSLALIAIALAIFIRKKSKTL